VLDKEDRRKSFQLGKWAMILTLNLTWFISYFLFATLNMSYKMFVVLWSFILICVFIIESILNNGTKRKK